MTTITPHDHGHTGLEERVAMLTYMLVVTTSTTPRSCTSWPTTWATTRRLQLIHDAVVDFEVGNKKLAEALVVLKGE